MDRQILRYYYTECAVENGLSYIMQVYTYSPGYILYFGVIILNRSFRYVIIVL